MKVNSLDPLNEIFQSVEKDAYFANIRLDLHRASFRYGDKAVFDFLSSVVSDFNSNAFVLVDEPND